MDSVFYFVLGALIVSITSYDLIFTTFAPRGAGIISGTVTTVIWKWFGILCRVTGKRSFLSGAGVIIICTLLVVWVLLLWLGNMLIFMSDTDAVVNSTTNIPADNFSRAYFTGYILSTLGNGDYKGGTDGWRLYSSFISFTGLILITIAISYMVPVLSAVTERRSISIRIAALGNSPQHMLLNNWNGKTFEQLESQIDGLAQSIAMQGQLHLAYPVLHYFFHNQKNVALLPNLAALDEALTILLLYVPEQNQPSRKKLIPLRKSISTFLESLNSMFLKPDESGTPGIDVSMLKEAGIPLKQPNLEDIKRLNHRRQTLKAMVDNYGWRWGELNEPAFSSDIDLPAMV